jgi:hypothetical protein
MHPAGSNSQDFSASALLNPEDLTADDADDTDQRRSANLIQIFFHLCHLRLILLLRLLRALCDFLPIEQESTADLRR